MPRVPRCTLQHVKLFEKVHHQQVTAGVKPSESEWMSPHRKNCISKFELERFLWDFEILITYLLLPILPTNSVSVYPNSAIARSPWNLVQGSLGDDSLGLTFSAFPNSPFLAYWWIDVKFVIYVTYYSTMKIILLNFPKFSPTNFFLQVHRSCWSLICVPCTTLEIEP